MTKQSSGRKEIESPLGNIRRLFFPSQLRAEKARLEAFLSAMPGDYCGFGDDGTIAYSQGFLDALGLNAISGIDDILWAFDNIDSAALDAHFTALQDSGRAFSYSCESRHTRKTLKITGTRGEALDATDGFSILWLVDQTDESSKIADLGQRLEETEYDVFRFRSALDAMPLLSWIRDSAGDLIWCNKSYADALGVNKSEIIGRQLELPLTASKRKSGERKDASKTDHPVRGLALAALKQDSKQQESLHSIIGGKRLLLSVQESPLSGGSGTLGLAQDITREEELETEQKRYLSANKELLQQLQTAIGIFDADTAIEFYNDAFSHLWGLEASWLDKHPRLSEIMDKLRETRQLPEQADFRSYKQEWLDMFTSLVGPHEQMLYLPNGDVLRMLVIPHPMGGLMMTFEDVTSRLELESSYNTLIAVQKETLDNLSESVIVFGGDGRIKLWNPAFRKLWDLNNEDLDGEPHVTKLVDKLSGFFTQEEWPEVKDEFKSLALDRSERAGRFERDDDTLLEYATVPLPDGGMLITFFDVTDKVRVERALREKNQALQDAEKLKSDFLANVSYQLRTPLNSIMGFNEILTHEYFGPLNDKQKEYTHGIFEASEKLRDLIDNILDIASFEAGTLTLNHAEFEIKPVMEQIHEIVDVWAKKEGIDLTLKCPKNIGKMTADPQRLKQALLNILGNSIEFTPENGSITLSASRKQPNIIFTITDTGVGITENDIKRIFKPFEKAEGQSKGNGDTARSGVGLGLSLVRNIVDMHGGDIEIDSRPGKGTTIELILPADTTDQKKPESES